MAKTLKRIDVAEDVFNSVLERFPDNIELVPDIQPYYKGHPDKWKVFYCEKTRYMVTKECFVTYTASTNWKQVIVRCDNNLPAGKIVSSIDGTRAWIEVNKQLNKYYTAEEKEACLLNHTAKFNEKLAQQHFNYVDYYNLDKIIRVKNCVKYDINGAHCDALKEIFPKAAKYFEKLYRDRKVNPAYKAYANYYVGMLAHKEIYRETYNWIVQRTTQMLVDAANEVGGENIYINTDGFVVTNIKKPLDKVKANTLGWFKLEYSGDVYIYQGTNYWIMQTADGEIKGNAMLSVRPHIDLKNGKVVKYKRTPVKDADGKTLFYQAADLEIEIREVKDYE